MAVLDYQAPQAKRPFPWRPIVTFYLGNMFLPLVMVSTAGYFLEIAAVAAIPALIFLVATVLLFVKTDRVWMRHAGIAAGLVGVFNPIGAGVLSFVHPIAGIIAYLVLPGVFAGFLTFPLPPLTCPACRGACDEEDKNCPHCSRALSAGV